VGKRKLKYRSNVHLLKTGVYALKVRKEYFSFGMQMPGRFTNSTDYRFGYNGMEKDKEIKGDGNSYTTEFRQYDPRLGRWLSLDPLMAMFPDMSPYVAFDNNPIYYNDPLGLAPEGGDGDPPGTGKGEEDWGGSSSSKPVDITAEKSCASEDYKNWYKERGGSEFWHGVSNEIYNRKVKACQNGLARMRWGTDEFGDARIPQELKDKKRAEAEAETKDAIHAAYATDKSGVDPTSMKYTFNPFARTAWLRARALAVSSRDEGMSLLSGVAFDCAVSWLSSRGLMKGPNFKMGRKFGRAAYRTEVKGLQNTVNEMRLAKCSSEEIARKVHQMRRDIGLKYKNLSNPDLLEKIYKRNIDKYGDKLGPTIEFLIEKGKSWDDIIESAIRPGGKDLGL
jgi:RHS repeat-associated protein